MKLLDKINNVDEECSNFDEQDLSKIEDNMESDNDLFAADELEFPDRNNEKENIINKRREHKRSRLLLSSESESDIKGQHIKIASDETVSEKIEEISKLGRTPVHNIFREVFGPTGYAKRHVMKGKVKTAFSVIIDQHIMEEIKTCTEEKAFVRD